MAFPEAPETNATLATRDAHATAQLSKPRPARRGPVPPPPLPSGVIRLEATAGGAGPAKWPSAAPETLATPATLEAEHGCQRQSRMPGGRARVPKAEPDARWQSAGA